MKLSKYYNFIKSSDPSNEKSLISCRTWPFKVDFETSFYVPSKFQTIMSSFGSFGYNISEEDGISYAQKQLWIIFSLISLSLPYDMGYPDGDKKGLAALMNENKPRILMCGQRMSGKTSILKVVFHKMSANETLYLGETNELIRDDINNSVFVQFHIWDVPGKFS